MNQQQLQNARTALWRQDGDPLLTGDDAAAWLEEMGICLFLPRHAQLPAPATSFVEACAGEARAVPPAAAIDGAMALATRLVAEGRAVPLNLMGNLTEQPDFLASPEALRWVAAVRGDRNWKAAPGGRTAPIVLRVWEALDRQRGRTEPEIRDELGRELTEAAVIRALVELWTTMRAAPEYAAGEPTRWSLMRDRYPKEMAAGANTAQATALSALISLYLRQAVAATAEEAEVFLSPLTARSRIREVVHGMLAARQFGTTAMGTQTLLYLEGTLPEAAEAPTAEAEPGVTPEMAAEAREKRETLRRAVEREPWKESRGEPKREPRPGFGRGKRPEGRPKRGERPKFDRGKKPAFGAGSGAGDRPGPRFGQKPGEGPDQRRRFGKPGGRPGGKPGGKPWEKRGEFRGPRREGRSEAGGKFGKRREGDREFRREGKEGGWQAPRRPERAAGPNRPQREGRPEGPGEERGAGRSPGRRDFQRKPWQFQRRQGEGRGSRPKRGEFRRERREAREDRGSFRREMPATGGNRSGPRSGKGPASSGKARKPKFGRAGKPAGAGERRNRGPGRPFREGESRPERPNWLQRPGSGPGSKPGTRPSGPGKPDRGEKFEQQDRGGAKFGKPGGGRFGKVGKPRGAFGGRWRKSTPGENRTRENRPAGPRSGKNRKGQEDKPE